MKKGLLVIGVCSLAILFGYAFATSNEKSLDVAIPSDASVQNENNIIPVSYSVETDFSEDRVRSVISKTSPDTGEEMISIDGGDTWITQKEYKNNYPNYPQIQDGNSLGSFFMAVDESEGSGFFFDSNVMTKIKPDNDNVLVSIDKGKTWLTIAEYREQYPDYPEIPYKNAEEFQKWINENIKKVQDGYWDKTGGKGWSW